MREGIMNFTLPSSQFTAPRWKFDFTIFFCSVQRKFFCFSGEVLNPHETSSNRAFFVYDLIMKNYYQLGRTAVFGCVCVSSSRDFPQKQKLFVVVIILANKS